MPYASKRSLSSDNEIKWGMVILTAVLTFAGSIFLGRWFGNKLLESRTGIKAPPPAVVYTPPNPPLNDVMQSSTLSPERQNIASPPLVVPPPAMGQTGQSEPTQSTETQKSQEATQSNGQEDKPVTAASPAETAKNKTTAVVPFKGSVKFRIQAGLFASSENAKDLLSHLQTEGYGSGLEMISHPEGAYYRVWVGPYDSKEEAQSIAQELSGKGYQAFVLGDENTH